MFANTISLTSVKFGKWTCFAGNYQQTDPSTPPHFCGYEGDLLYALSLSAFLLIGGFVSVSAAKFQSMLPAFSRLIIECGANDNLKIDELRHR